MITIVDKTDVLDNHVGGREVSMSVVLLSHGGKARKSQLAAHNCPLLSLNYELIFYRLL